MPEGKAAVDVTSTSSPGRYPVAKNTLAIATSRMFAVSPGESGSASATVGKAAATEPLSAVADSVNCTLAPVGTVTVDASLTPTTFSVMLTAWLNCFLLYLTLRKRGHFSLAPDVIRRVSRQILCGLAMGATLYAVNLGLGPMFNGASLQRMLALALLIGSGGLVYFGLGWIIGALDRESILMLLRRKRPAPEETA